MFTIIPKYIRSLKPVPLKSVPLKSKDSLQARIDLKIAEGFKDVRTVDDGTTFQCHFHSGLIESTRFQVVKEKLSVLWTAVIKTTLPIIVLGVSKKKGQIGRQGVYRISVI